MPVSHSFSDFLTHSHISPDALVDTFSRQRQRRCVVQSDARNIACDFCSRNKYECTLAANSTSPTVEHAHGPVHESEMAASPPYGQIPTLDHPPSISAPDEVITAFPVHSGLKMPPAEAYLEIASKYFTYIHDPSHNVFHRPSFMADLSSGTVPRSILLCVIALAAR